MQTDEESEAAAPSRALGRYGAPAGLAVAGLALLGVVLQVWLAAGTGRTGARADRVPRLPNTVVLRTAEDDRPVAGARCRFFSDVPDLPRQLVARAVSDARGLVDYDVPAWAAPDGWLGLEVEVDPGVVVFRGRVASLRGAHLKLPADIRDRCLSYGSVRLRDPGTTLWMTAVRVAGESRVLGSSGPARRDLNEADAARIRFDDLDGAGYAGAVELVAFGVGDGEDLHVVACQPFRSLRALRAAMQFGVELVAPRRELQLPAEPVVDALLLRSDDREHDVRFRLEPNRFDGVALPASRYTVLGLRGDAPVALGRVETEGSGPVRVVWEHRLPGEHAVTVELRDALGRPVADGEVRWQAGQVLRGRGRTDARGELVVGGLPGLMLEFRAASGGRRASARIQPREPATRLALRLRDRSRWMAVPRFPGQLPVDAHATLQLFEFDPLLGIHAARSEPGSLDLLEGLETGRHTWTLCGAGGWFGTAQVEVRSAGGRIEVPVRRLAPVAGELAGPTVHRAAELVVGSLGFPDLPRLAVAVEPGGRFRFVPRTPGPWVVAIRDFEGAVLHVGELHRSRPRIEVR